VFLGAFIKATQLPSGAGAAFFRGRSGRCSLSSIRSAVPNCTARAKNGHQGAVTQIHLLVSYNDSASGSGSILRPQCYGPLAGKEI
jgi:hypothetical protein